MEDLTISYGVDKETAVRFTKYMQKYPELYAEFTEIILKYTEKKNPIILDVGMGPGLLLTSILEKIPEANVIGIDPLDQMVQEAFRQSKNRYNVIQGISEKMPFCTETIDIVVSRFSLPYWTNPQQSFLEIYRLLDKRGMVILDVLNTKYSKIKLSLIKIHMHLRRTPGSIIRYHLDSYKIAYDLDKIRSLMENAGFNVESATKTPTNWHYFLVASK